jgi:hypothetical protein
LTELEEIEPGARLGGHQRRTTIRARQKIDPTLLAS